jgi:hypothetical protein
MTYPPGRHTNAFRDREWDILEKRALGDISHQECVHLLTELYQDRFEAESAAHLISDDNDKGTLQ